ncbi:hypothetical protein EXIGLDRAFT_102260 [Exidia glandulosa HHB12029]|uniref:Uncharacterized protein n=1 Tax=Exidia glandulosa HHB12029 TaxID=1314781 RepID=A0A165GZP3_EXIGL|nr:hypothetical protein EXIGLDRAFT_102260 [Exidia glandulosa HHB12029]
MEFRFFELHRVGLHSHDILDARSAKVVQARGRVGRRSVMLREPVTARLTGIGFASGSRLSFNWSARRVDIKSPCDPVSTIARTACPLIFTTIINGTGISRVISFGRIARLHRSRRWCRRFSQYEDSNNPFRSDRLSRT